MDAFRDVMTNAFEMLYSDIMHYFRGLEVGQLKDGILQGKYIIDLIDKSKMTNCKEDSTSMGMGEKIVKDDGRNKVDHTMYGRLVGSHMYLISIRPNIMYAMSLVSRFIQDPSETHFRVAKRILKYTDSFGILYTSFDCSSLVRYTNNDWVGSFYDSKSKSSSILWFPKKHSTILLSTTKVEYIVATLAT